ncbi:MAG: hypothetical protein Q4F12_01795 [Erysipelotrichaceae bacterium]|nr:hypothetical protein [Erysipelotrichaceae bacterium]
MSTKINSTKQNTNSYTKTFNVNGNDINKSKIRKIGCLKDKYDYNSKDIDWFNDDIVSLFLDNNTN